MTAICIGCAFFLRDYILVAEILDSHDMYYLNRSKSGIFSNIIMLIPTFLLIVVWFMKANSIIGNRDDKMRFLEILIAFDCIIIPVAAVFGIWRANEYMYLPRLSLWGVIVFSIAQKFARNSRSFNLPFVFHRLFNMACLSDFAGMGAKWINALYCGLI